MSFLNNIDNITSKVSDSLGKMKKSANEFLTNALDAEIPIHYFPKIELIARKYKVEKAKREILKIDDYANKYCISNLNKHIKSLPDSEKAKIYRSIGYKLFIISVDISRVATFSNELSAKYYERALRLLPDNLEIAYGLFKVYNWNALRGHNKRGVEVAQLCLNLPNDNNIKIENDSIYYYIGEYYYFEEKNYKKALEYFQKALDSSEPFSFHYYQAKEYLAYSYDYLGQYKTALELIESVVKDKGENYSSNIREFLYNVREKVEVGLTKDEEDHKNMMKNIEHYFRESIGRHPEEVLIEAYKIFLNADNLIFQNKYSEAIEAYKEVRKLLPEQNLFMFDKIRSVKNLMKEKKQSKDTRETIEVLKEKLEIALETGKDLCNTYNQLGIAYSELKEFEKAINYFRKAAETSSNPCAFFYNIAKCYEDMESYDEAISYYEKIKRVDSELAKSFKVDYHITCLEDKKAGIDNKNNFPQKHYNDGNLAFDHTRYEEAFKEYNAAYESNKRNIDYIFRMVFVKDFSDALYIEEKELCFKALNACEEMDDFSYLPYFFTILGDSLIYNDIDQSKPTSRLYNLAIDLLEIVPTEQRFAAPYYKLSRLNEQKGKYEDALSLLKQTNEIDSSYNINIDVNRILSQLRDGGESNKIKEKEYLKLLRNYMNSGFFADLLSEGQKALDFAPNNPKIYYYICQAAIESWKYYELKWAAIEGLRSYNYDFERKSVSEDFFLYMLGMCCKHELKEDEAYTIFDSIVGDDPLRSDEITRKAFEEKCQLERKGFHPKDIFDSF